MATTTKLDVPVPQAAAAPPTSWTGHFLGSQTWAAGASRSPSVGQEHVSMPPPGVGTSPGAAYHSADNEDALADLVSRYGSSSSLAWLDTERYKLWRPSQPIPESEFTPVQGYFEKDHYAFAWGNPLVSSPDALEKTARAFIAFVEVKHMHPIWCCADPDLEAVLSSPALGWVTMSCIYEDVIDPAHVVELLGPKQEHRSPTAEHLMKSITKAKLEHLEVHEVKHGEWHAAEREEVEAGIKEWKAHRSGIEFDTMSAKPWLDEAHRRYWIAVKDGKVVGVEILSRSSPTSWNILKCISFRPAMAKITENLIMTALKDIYTEEEEQAKRTLSISVVTPEAQVDAENSVPVPAPAGDEASDKADAKRRIVVTFGITAASHLEPGHNLGGWRVSVLSRTYSAVSGMAGLQKVTTFRKQFEAKEEPMYICYPANRFGFLSIGPLLLTLRK